MPPSQLPRMSPYTMPPSWIENSLLKLPRTHSVPTRLFAIFPNSGLFPQTSVSQGSVSPGLCFRPREELAGLGAEVKRKPKHGPKENQPWPGIHTSPGRTLSTKPSLSPLSFCVTPSSIPSHIPSHIPGTLRPHRQGPRHPPEHPASMPS